MYCQTNWLKPRLLFPTFYFTATVLLRVHAYENSTFHNKIKNMTSLAENKKHDMEQSILYYEPMDEGYKNHDEFNKRENTKTALAQAIDITVQLASGTFQASRNRKCFDNLQELMTRHNIPINASMYRHVLSDGELLRLGLLASIALISPWDQDPGSKHLIISDQGVLIEAYHPSSSESDIMLCVVCSLLAVIVMFHVTGAQLKYVTTLNSATSSKG